MWLWIIHPGGGTGWISKAKLWKCQLKKFTLTHQTNNFEKNTIFSSINDTDYALQNDENHNQLLWFDL